MSKESLIDQLAPAAQADMQEFGILASVTIAQAILESGWGCSAPGNILFGIKGSWQLQVGAFSHVLIKLKEERGDMMSSDDANKIITFYPLLG